MGRLPSGKVANMVNNVSFGDIDASNGADILAIQPERPEAGIKRDDVDASINARLTRHLMDHAARPGDAVAVDAGAMSLRERVIVTGGMVFLASILGLFSILDIRKRFL